MANVTSIVGNLKPVRIGIALAILSIIYGYCLGGAFGAFEGPIEHYLEAKGEAVLDTVYEGDRKWMESVADKSWKYLKRSHLHANAMGTAAVSLILVLSFLPMKRKIKGAVAFCLGLGALGYGLFWSLAGITAPGLGGTGNAKEALKFLAIPAAGLSIIGVTATFWFVLKSLFCGSEEQG